MINDTEIKIIRAETKDAAEIAALEKDNLSVAWSGRSLFEALESETYIYYIAVDRDKTVASGGMMTVCGEAEITNIVVNKDHRKRGIASSVLASLIGEAFSQGCESVFLEVAANNTPAIKLYEKFGFIRTGIRKNYYRDPLDDAILMKKSLQ